MMEHVKNIEVTNGTAMFVHKGQRYLWVTYGFSTVLFQKVGEEWKQISTVKSEYAGSNMIKSISWKPL
jgi:3-methyladenine DNA glycosylase Mpg